MTLRRGGEGGGEGGVQGRREGIQQNAGGRGGEASGVNAFWFGVTCDAEVIDGCFYVYVVEDGVGD